MATTLVLEDLVPIRYYTPLDPYYYTVDNRPLEDLDSNIQLVAAASDASAGGANRSAMAAAAVAYSNLGFGVLDPTDPQLIAQGMYAGNYTINFLTLVFSHGYLVKPLNLGGTPQYVEPIMGVHDAVTTTSQINAGGTSIVWASSLPSDASSRVPSTESPVEVVTIQATHNASPTVDPAPPGGNNWIALLRIRAPSGAISISPSDITQLNMRTIDQLSNPLSNAVIRYNAPATPIRVNPGSNVISLTGTPIDTTRMEAVEVFVDGVNQFNWTYNPSTNQIILEDAVTSLATARVRQTAISLG